jgi:hypothetical protein
LNKVAELRNSPDVIQQVPLAFKNYEKLSQENKVLEVLCSLQHSVRSFGVEKIKLLLSSLTSMKIPQYCMGACLHIKLRTLLLNNKFPFFVDDLTLGYRLSIKGCNFAYLPTYNYSLSQNKVADYVNSQVLIFKGVSTYLNEVYRTKGYFYGKVKMFISGTGNLSMFVLIPFLVIIYYLYMLFTWNITLLGVMLFTTHYLWSISSYIHIKLNGFKNDKKSISFLAIILSPIWQIFRPSGYIVFLKRFIISKITKSNIKYRKTER